MSRYIPNGEEHRRRMLDEIGVDSFEDLLTPIPDEYRFRGELSLPPALSEIELQRDMAVITSRDTGADHVCFLGGGAYDHFVPSAIDHILLRSEFFTAYTPYQAEVSQGNPSLDIRVPDNDQSPDRDGDGERLCLRWCDCRG